MEIRLLIDKSPGTLARVLNCVRRLGMAVDKQHLEKSNDSEHNELIVDAEGTTTAAEISQSLAGIKGVVEVLNVGEPGSASSATV